MIRRYSAFFLLFMLANAAMALNPSREYSVTPEKYGMKYKEEKILTSDGASLNAWFFEFSKKTTNTIVISGSGDGNMADNLEIAGQFISLGYNVMMYDYRGYGKSSDFAIDKDTYIYPQFITDLNTVLDYLRKSRAITKFDLYGQNIGAGLSMGVGATRTETRKIIADGPWVSLETMKSKIKEKKGTEVIIPFGFNKNNEPLYAFEKQKAHLKGMMVIVSPKDEYTGPGDIKLIKNNLTETYIVKNSADNSKNFTTDKNAYFEKISKFLQN